MTGSYHKQTPSLRDLPKLDSELATIEDLRTVVAQHNTGLSFDSCPMTHTLTATLPSAQNRDGQYTILSYIVILKAHNNHIVVVLQLSSYRLHIIGSAFT